MACENDIIQLMCNPYSRIAIYSASYGRTEYESLQCAQPQGVREESKFHLFIFFLNSWFFFVCSFFIINCFYRRFLLLLVAQIQFNLIYCLDAQNWYFVGWSGYIILSSKSWICQNEEKLSWNVHLSFIFLSLSEENLSFSSRFSLPFLLNR